MTLDEIVIDGQYRYLSFEGSWCIEPMYEECTAIKTRDGLVMLKARYGGYFWMEPEKLDVAKWDVKPEL
jgi:hypothetical protein